MKLPNSASIVWTIGLAASILTALLAMSGKFSPEVKNALEIAAAIVGAISLYLKQSPAPEPPRDVWTPEKRAANGGV